MFRYGRLTVRWYATVLRYDVVVWYRATVCYVLVFGGTVGPNARVAPVDRENKLFVGMLPHDADDMTLTEVFSGFGEITEVSPVRSVVAG